MGRRNQDLDEMDFYGERDEIERIIEDSGHYNRNGEKRESDSEDDDDIEGLFTFDQCSLTIH